MSQASIAIRFKALILLLVLCINIAACDKDNTEEEVLSEVELVNIGDDLELWSELVLNKNQDDSVKTKLAHSILRKIFIVRTQNPNIDHINGRALETLCILMEPESKKILDRTNDPELVKIAVEYLDSIEVQTKERIKNIQKNLKGSGCYLSPR